MLEFSEGVLKKGYTIFISKKSGQYGLQGVCLKSSQSGLSPYELPEKELTPLIHLPNIVEQLGQGALLQVRQNGFSINGTIGCRKTEGPYCETELLEVIEEEEGLNYHEMLVDLDMKLSCEKVQQANQSGQYTKLYKGADKYE